jgi:hypothetical protein
MAFRNKAWAKCWKIEEKDGRLKARISTSRKIKDSDEYEQDFSGFVDFYGCVDKAKKLKENDRFQILECGVTTKYVKETGKEYTNYHIYDLELSEGQQSSKANNEEDKDETTVDDEDVPF